jgi:phosphoglycolate phosphatase-like HAD superfamily hydrolase
VTFTQPPRASDTLPALIRDRLSLLLFDLDGVISNERPYWEAARLTVLEVLEGKDCLRLRDYFGIAAVSTSARPWDECILPEDLIYAVKNRAINSNWDLAFLAAVLYLVPLLAELHGHSPAALQEILHGTYSAEDKVRRLGELLPDSCSNLRGQPTAIEQFLAEAGSRNGAALLNHLQAFVAQAISGDGSFFRPHGEFWLFCQRRFQEWLNGKQRPAFVTAAQAGSESVVDAAQLAGVLKALYDSGRYVLGVATGRPRSEARAPLVALDILRYFEERRVITNEMVEEAETALARLGKKAVLGKPHPFILLKAIHPEKEHANLWVEPPASLDHGYAAYIGDTASDVVAAKRAGCVSIGVLTGVRNDPADQEARRRILTELGCDLVLNSVLELPSALGVV